MKHNAVYTVLSLHQHAQTFSGLVQRCKLQKQKHAVDRIRRQPCLICHSRCYALPSALAPCRCQQTARLERISQHTPMVTAPQRFRCARRSLPVTPPNTAFIPLASLVSSCLLHLPRSAEHRATKGAPMLATHLMFMPPQRTAGAPSFLSSTRPLSTASNYTLTRIPIILFEEHPCCSRTLVETLACASTCRSPSNSHACTHSSAFEEAAFWR